jgi:hypothetical protein
MNPLDAFSIDFTTTYMMIRCFAWFLGLTVEIGS